MLPSFASARVLVVGDVMLDRYWFGATSRISPEAPVPVVRVEDEDTRLGGAANVAVNLAALGAQVQLIGLIGDDDPGRQLIDLVERHHIAHDIQRVAGNKTINKLRIMSRSQQLLRLDIEDYFTRRDDQALIGAYTAALDAADVIVISDYAKGTLRNLCGDLIGQAKQAGKFVIVDPKGRSFDPYRGADLITPNLSEFETVMGTCQNRLAIEERATEARRRHALGAILVTLGEDGMLLIAQNGSPIHLPAQAKEVFDVTGAGDTVVATLAAMLATNSPLELAVAVANAAAGIVVGKRGTAAISREELTELLQVGVERESDRKLLDRATLRERVAESRRRGETVVMTNGCFDLLHAGHVHYLERAKALGDRLIVAVNDDASVRRLKGSRRPINPLADRLHVLAGLTSVDWLVAFNDDTPADLYAEILPDVIVKGGDYSSENVAGGDIVKASGGRVEIIPLLEGRSTTAILQQADANEPQAPAHPAS